MTGNVNHIIRSTRDKEIPVLVKVTPVTGVVVAGVLSQISINKTVMVVPYGRQTSRR